MHALSNAVSGDDITECLEILPQKLTDVTPKWWLLGLQLKQLPAPLDAIQANPGQEPVAEKFRRMLSHWIQYGQEDKQTWGALAKAVDKSGNKWLGNKIREQAKNKESEKGNSTFPGAFS